MSDGSAATSRCIEAGQVRLSEDAPSSSVLTAVPALASPAGAMTPSLSWRGIGVKPQSCTSPDRECVGCVAAQAQRRRERRVRSAGRYDALIRQLLVLRIASALEGEGIATIRRQGTVSARAARCFAPFARRLSVSPWLTPGMTPMSRTLERSPDVILDYARTDSCQILRRKEVAPRATPSTRMAPPPGIEPPEPSSDARSSTTLVRSFAAETYSSPAVLCLRSEHEAWTGDRRDVLTATKRRRGR